MIDRNRLFNLESPKSTVENSSFTHRATDVVIAVSKRDTIWHLYIYSRYQEDVGKAKKNRRLDNHLLPRDAMPTVTKEHIMQANSPSTPTLTPTPSRQVFWQRHVNQWRDSGLSKKAYARQHSLAYQQMVYWSGKADKETVDTKHRPADFIPVTLTHAPRNSTLSIRLPNGIAIEGIDEFSVTLIGKLIKQL